MGGIIIGQEMGRALGKDAMFLERPEGTFHLRRGFRLEPGAKVLMVEDVVTTGLSSREAIAAVSREGGQVVAEVALVDRSNGAADLGVPLYATPFTAELVRRKLKEADLVDEVPLHIVREGDQDIISTRPFGFVNMLLAARHPVAKDYPSFDPLTILSGDTQDEASPSDDKGPAIIASQIYGSRVETDIKLKMSDFASPS